MSDGRRTLEFSSLAEVMPEVDRLLPGHRTAGNWSLGQVCNHLTLLIIGSVDGFKVRAPWIIRRTIGGVVIRRLLKTRRIPDGIKTSEEFVPKPGVDARAEAEALRAAIRGFGTHPGPFAEHPFFGTLTREDWEHLHTLHAAHHLRFILPEASPA